MPRDTKTRLPQNEAQGSGELSTCSETNHRDESDNAKAIRVTRALLDDRSITSTQRLQAIKTLDSLLARQAAEMERADIPLELRRFIDQELGHLA